MKDAGAVFFDIDGVVLDSLPSHLRICKDKAKAFGLNLKIPDEASFRAMILQNKRISPMYYFFTAVGFPDNLAERAAKDYDLEFMKNYRPKPYKYYANVLSSIRECGWKIGMVTSNVESNVFPALGSSINEFENDCIFTFDRAPQKSKAWCLKEGAYRLKKNPSDCYYVGDLPSDAAAAKEAGFNFIGAAYGWGIDKGSSLYSTIDSILEIPEKLGCHERSNHV